MRGLLLSVLSTAAGYSFHGIPIKAPPIELTTELQVARWLWDEFKDACSKFRGDMRRSVVFGSRQLCDTLLPSQASRVPDINDDWHDEWHKRGQRAGLEAMRRLPDSEDDVEMELRREVDAGQHRLHRLRADARQFEEQGDLHACKDARKRVVDLGIALEPHMVELRDRGYAKWDNQTLADELRREDAFYDDRHATFVALRKQGKHAAAKETWDELCWFGDRRIGCTGKAFVSGVRGPAGLLRDEGPRSRRTEGDDGLPREVPGSLARRHQRGGGLTIH